MRGQTAAIIIAVAVAVVFATGPPWWWNYLSTSHTSSASTTAPPQSPADGPTRTPAAKSPSLQSGLLPASTLGASATIKDTTTEVADLAGVCGEPAAGAKAAAGEEIWTGSTPAVAEAIGYWESAVIAGSFITSERNSLAQSTNGCSTVFEGSVSKWEGSYPANPPPSCSSPGAEFVTEAYSQNSPGSKLTASGYYADVQCGDITIYVTTPSGSLQTALTYLNTAVAQFAATIGPAYETRS
jgi:hypothetical protein